MSPIKRHSMLRKSIVPVSECELDEIQGDIVESYTSFCFTEIIAHALSTDTCWSKWPILRVCDGTRRGG